MNKFENNIISIYGSKGKKWLIDLLKVVEEISIEWNLSNLKPLDNLSMNYLVSGFQRSQEIILKLSLDADLIKREYTALKALVDFGAVEVLAYKEKALLLKRVIPAVSLKSYLPDKRIEALKIACEVTKKLHQASLPNNIKLPTIEERFSLLDKNCSIPTDLIILARKYRDEIFLKYQDRKVLHGDLHHDNIISDGNSWKVIDPHGVIGFSINEVWAFIQDVDEDVPFVANYLGFNAEDIKKSYFMHAILSALWAIEDNMNPSFWMGLALKMNKF